MWRATAKVNKYVKDKLSIIFTFAQNILIVFLLVTKATRIFNNLFIILSAKLIDKICLLAVRTKRSRGLQH